VKRLEKLSAGLLMYRRNSLGAVEFFLVHPGGPFWVRRDVGAWTIPKGTVGDIVAGEEAFAAACREFLEETGFQVGAPLLDLGSVRQKGGKIVRAWAFEGDCDPAQLRSNTMVIEWSPNSGSRREIPEVDRGEYFEYEVAKCKINVAQVAFLDRLCTQLQVLKGD